MNKKKIVLGIGIFAVLIAALVAAWIAFGQKPVEGSKSITIEVVNSQKESEVYELKTDALYLQEAMDEAKEDGLSYTCENGMVLKVNGERADYNKDGAYWGFFVNGEYAQYGIAEQPVEDGDAFKIEYTKAE